MRVIFGYLKKEIKLNRELIFGASLFLEFSGVGF